MANKRKKKVKDSSAKFGGIITDKVGNYGNHPFFLKKAEDAKAFLEKAGLPESFVKDRLSKKKVGK